MIKNSLFFLFVISVSSTVQAQRFDITTDIGQIRYHEASSTLSTSWKQKIWFGLKGPDNFPTNCPKYNDEHLIGVPSGNSEAVSMLLTAKTAGLKVLVTIDDTVKLGSYCRLQYLTIK